MQNRPKTNVLSFTELCTNSKSLKEEVDAAHAQKKQVMSDIRAAQFGMISVIAEDLFLNHEAMNDELKALIMTSLLIYFEDKVRYEHSGIAGKVSAGLKIAGYGYGSTFLDLVGTASNREKLTPVEITAAHSALVKYLVEFNPAITLRAAVNTIIDAEKTEVTEEIAATTEMKQDAAPSALSKKDAEAAEKKAADAFKLKMQAVMKKEEFLMLEKLSVAEMIRDLNSILQNRPNQNAVSKNRLQHLQKRAVKPIRNLDDAKIIINREIRASHTLKAATTKVSKSIAALEEHKSVDFAAINKANEAKRPERLREYLISKAKYKPSELNAQIRALNPDNQKQVKAVNAHKDAWSKDSTRRDSKLEWAAIQTGTKKVWLPNEKSKLDVLEEPRKLRGIDAAAANETKLRLEIAKQVNEQKYKSLVEDGIALLSDEQKSTLKGAELNKQALLKLVKEGKTTYEQINKLESGMKPAYFSERSKVVERENIIRPAKKSFVARPTLTEDTAAKWAPATKEQLNNKEVKVVEGYARVAMPEVNGVVKKPIDVSENVEFKPNLVTSETFAKLRSGKPAKNKTITDFVDPAILAADQKAKSWMPSLAGLFGRNKAVVPAAVTPAASQENVAEAASTSPQLARK